METLKIEIVNPKAKKLLQELANLKLIRIEKEHPEAVLKQLFYELRNQENTLTLDDITREVEAVRSERHAAKAR